MSFPGVIFEDTEVLSAGEDVIALTPFDQDGVAADYALVRLEVLGPKTAFAEPYSGGRAADARPQRLAGANHPSPLQPGERVSLTGANDGRGHIAVQLVGSTGATLIEGR
jgi:hypothetical protein